MRGKGWKDYEGVCDVSSARCWLIGRCNGDCIFVNGDVVELGSGVFGVGESGEVIQGRGRFGPRVVMHGFRQTVNIRLGREDAGVLKGTPWDL